MHSSLHVYKYPNERAVNRPTCVVPLEGCILRSDPAQSSSNVFAFSVIAAGAGGGGTLLELAATTAEARLAWMASLADCGAMIVPADGADCGTAGRTAHGTMGTSGGGGSGGGWMRGRRDMWWRREAASGARGTRREEEAVQQRRREAAGAKAYADAAAKSEAATSFDMPASAKVHRRSISSILSSERLSYQRHDGLVNLGTVIILATNFRLILENLLKYGLRVHPLAWLIPNVHNATSPEAVTRTRALLAAWPALFANCIISHVLEIAAMRLAARRAALGFGSGSGVMGALLFVLMAANVASALAIPSYLIHATVAEPLAGFALVMVSVVVFLKLWSYMHANMHLRGQWQARLAVRIAQNRHHQQQQHQQQQQQSPMQSPGQQPSSSENSENFAMSESEIDDDNSSVDGDVSSGDDRISFPDNLVLKSFAYFMVAPTLCYQMSYPRSPTTRVVWLLRRIAEMFIYLSLMVFLIEQYIIPSVNNSVVSLAEVNQLVLSGNASQKTATALATLLERVLKLSIPTLYVWLCGFYCLFHLWLNILAELTRFGDRQFYKDWWNASTIDQYWRLWNMPVHKWLVRHVYFPSLRLGMGKGGATFVVFLFSAIFHELVVGLPLHVFRLWAFVGIMTQLPLISLTTFVKNKLKSDQVRESVRHDILICVFVRASRPSGVDRKSD